MFESDIVIVIDDNNEKHMNNGEEDIMIEDQWIENFQAWYKLESLSSFSVSKRRLEEQKKLLEPTIFWQISPQNFNQNIKWNKR